MIRVDQVTKMYGTTLAVNMFSIEVSRGEVCVLIGPSGCGKTTLLRMINRLIEPSSGCIYIDNKDNSLIKPEILRRSIGYAIQNVGLFPHMTVARNIAIVPELLHWDKARTDRRVRELLNLVGLNAQEYMTKYPRQLSGGEAQRIGVARSLAADPPILLMDEPFGAVDPLTREKLQEQFEQIQRELKKTVLLVTHDIDEAIRLADRIAIMKSGQLIQYDTPETLLAKPANEFVHDFIGTDRALKRLSSIVVLKYARPAPYVTIKSSLQQALRTIENEVSVWVVDENGKLLGWVNRDQLVKAQSIEEVVVYPNLDKTTLNTGATLRQALSVMLEQGIRTVPIIDENGRLIGEISLGDIEAATAHNEIKDAHKLD